MKTVEEFYKEISDSKELQEELNTMNEEVLGEFLKKHDCEADAKEFADFARSQEGEIQDDDAGAVAGGGQWTPAFKPPIKVQEVP